MNQTMQEQSTVKAHDHPEYSPGLEGGQDFKIRPTFADLGATVAAAFEVGEPILGRPLI